LADRLLIELLGSSDHACPNCGYLLRGLQQPVCPECGDRLSLCVGSTPPSRALPRLMIVAWLMGTGASVLLSMIAAANASTRWWTMRGGLILSAFLVLTITGLLATAVMQQRLSSMSVRVQFWLCLASWLSVVLLGLAVMATFGR